jgi:hypothetical protein
MMSDSDIRERLGPLTEPSPSPDQSPGRRAGGHIAAVAILLLLLWGGGIAVIAHLERISPRVAEPASGHVYRFSDSRHTVYFSQNEQYAAWAGIGIPLVATLGAAFMWFWRKTAAPAEG